MTNLIGLFFILSYFSIAKAQGGGQGSNLNPIEMSQFRDNITVMDEARKKNNTQTPAPAAPVTPVDSNTIIRPFVPVEFSVDKKSQDSANSNSQRVKSPFMIPNELLIKLKKSVGEKNNPVDNDDTVEVRLRWPLKDYRLVGVIYDTKSPRAMIADRQGKIEIYRLKDLIANAGGYIAEITNGEVIVVEKGVEIKLQLSAK